MVGFARELALEFAPRLGAQGAFLLKSVDALVSYYRILDSSGRCISVHDRSDLFDACMTCLQAYRHSGGHMIPKCHLWVHLTVQIAMHGNAKFYSTYVDEALNGTIKAIAQKSHQLTFSETIFRRVFSPFLASSFTLFSVASERCWRLCAHQAGRANRRWTRSASGAPQS